MGRTHELGPGNHNKAVVLEVSIGVRWGPAVGLVAHPGAGLPLPSIEADLDIFLMGVHEGQLRQQLRLIPRDDDETPFHGAGPHDGPGGTAKAPPAFAWGTVRQDVKRGKDKPTMPTVPFGLMAAPLAQGCFVRLTEAKYLAGLRRGTGWRRRRAILQRLDPGARRCDATEGPVAA